MLTGAPLPFSSCNGFIREREVFTRKKRTGAPEWLERGSWSTPTDSAKDLNALAGVVKVEKGVGQRRIYPPPYNLPPRSGPFHTKADTMYDSLRI